VGFGGAQAEAPLDKITIFLLKRFQNPCKNSFLKGAKGDRTYNSKAIALHQHTKKPKNKNGPEHTWADNTKQQRSENENRNLLNEQLPGQ
jgi:hypothetical protein